MSWEDHYDDDGVLDGLSCSGCGDGPLDAQTCAIMSDDSGRSAFCDACAADLDQFFDL